MSEYEEEEIKRNKHAIKVSKSLHKVVKSPNVWVQMFPAQMMLLPTFNLNGIITNRWKNICGEARYNGNKFHISIDFDHKYLTTTYSLEWRGATHLLLHVASISLEVYAQGASLEDIIARAITSIGEDSLTKVFCEGQLPSTLPPDYTDEYVMGVYGTKI
jgi:hypothetical protein